MKASRVFAYIPKRRHWASGRDGYLCVQCNTPIKGRWNLWVHKVSQRHPYIGDGKRRIYVQHTYKWTVTGPWIARDDEAGS